MGPADTASLEDLLERSALGDAGAFRAVYERAAPRLFAALMRMLKRQDVAEDVLQEVFVSVWRKANEYHRERGKALTWRLSIARYRALDVLRRTTRLVSVDNLSPDSMPGHEPDPLAVTAGDQDARSLSRCMGELSADHQRAIRLAYLDGYSHTEIATSLHTPLGTVKSWIRRGLRALKKCLEG